MCGWESQKQKCIDPTCLLSQQQLVSPTLTYWTIFGAKADTRWHFGFCSLPTRWSTSPFCLNCPERPEWHLSWEMDWPCIAKTLGSPFARFDPNGLFSPGALSRPRCMSWKINSLEQLKNHIFAAAEQITPDMLARVFRATKERWDMCFDLQGHHVEMYWVCVQNV